MTLPNKITIGRLIAVPFLLAALLLYGRTGLAWYYGAALVIFALAAVSDGLDGYLARSRDQKTQLGTLLDPLADKVLLDSAIIILASGIGVMYQIPVWFVLIVLCRDLILLAISLCLFKRWSQGTIQITPNWWGKTSAVLLMITVVLILLHPHQPPAALIRISIYLTTLLTVISGITYLIGTVKALRLSRPQR